MEILQVQVDIPNSGFDNIRAGTPNAASGLVAELSGQYCAHHIALLFPIV